MVRMPSQKRITFIFRLNLALALVEGLLVLWAFVKQPSEPGSAVFLGFSYLRLILILAVLCLLLVILALLSGTYRNSWQTQADKSLWVRLFNQKGTAWVFILWLAISYVLLFLSERQLGSLAQYRERLFPILLWFAALSLQFGFVVLFFRGIHTGIFREQRSLLVPSLTAFILFGLLLVTIKLTRLGLTPDSIYWQTPGAPILLQQVFLAAFAGILFYLFAERTSLGQSTRLDMILFLGLWGLACLIWLSQPAKLTHFSVEPTPPNYQSYPFSDALLYDNTAREYLIGKPIPSDFWAKPFYSFFLAVLHLFSGGNYTFLIALQVIVLALIPAFAYLLATRLDARPAGVIAALLLILRERNALALSNVIQVSHVKLLLSDVFAMGFMVLLLWLFFHWLEDPGGRRGAPLVLGGVLGLLILTRGHPAILVPFILCAVFFARFPRPHLRWEAVALTLLGLLIPLLPWFWRNYESTGKIVFQYPVSPYSAQISGVYSFAPGGFNPESLPPKNPGESDAAYYDRLQGRAVEFVMEHPDQVAKFISAHYFHNLIFSYIYLPYSFQIEEVRDYVKTQPFWNAWAGDLSLQGMTLLLINLVILALGLGYLWKKYGYMALVPLFLGIGYNLSVSVARLSGWRFILPADWITLIYYAVGLVQFYQVLRSFTNHETNFVFQENKTPYTLQPLRRSSLIGFALFFLAIGMALTNGQGLFSQRYPAKSTMQLQEDYNRITSGIPASTLHTALDKSLKTENAVIVYGQALNPSFLAADKEGLDRSWPVYQLWPNYKPQPFSRLIFNLNGPQFASVVLPLESPPSIFPDGVAVIVIGCRAGSGAMNALAVLMQDTSSIYYSSELTSVAACP